MQEQPPKEPAATPPAVAPILSYRGVVPLPASLGGRVIFQRRGNTLAATIPAPPFARRMVSRAIGLLLLATFAGLMSAILVIAILEQRHAIGPDSPVPIFIGGAITAWLWWQVVRLLRAILHLSRVGRNPSTVLLSSDALQVATPGTIRPLDMDLPRNQITDVEVRATGPTKLSLQVICNGDTLHAIAIPWPPGQPMVELEDNLRDVLGLRLEDSLAEQGMKE